MKGLYIFLVSLCSFVLVTSLAAQSSRDIANLMQDVELLKQQVSKLSYELQSVQQENRQLLAKVKESENLRENVAIQIASLNASVDTKVNALREQVTKASEKQKEQIIANVTEQIKQFAGDTEKAFEQMKKNAPVEKPSEKNGASGVVKTDFPTDFPKTGVEYTVKKGDTLSKISQDHHSKMSWIQNANKISVPTQIKVGQVLFIPQAAATVN